MDSFIWYDSRYFHPSSFRWIVEEMLLNPGDNVLDVGCGSGWLSRDIAKIVTQGRVVGLDASEKSLEKTKNISSHIKNLEFQNANVASLPYPDNIFDVAVSMESLPFWEDPEEGIMEIKRSLKVGGKLYIADGGGDGVVGFILVFITKIFNLFSPYKMKSFSPKEYRELLETAGFSDIDQRLRRMMIITVGTKV